jgi:hypothetical protein
MEFPRLVYKSASDHIAVNNADEFNQRLDSGWFASVPEALLPPVNVPVVDTVYDDAPATRAELEAKASELGLKFDKRTSDVKLGKMIDVALKV